MLKCFQCGTKDSKYEILISNNLVNKKNILQISKKYKKILIISDTGIPNSYINEFKDIFKISNSRLFIYKVNKGEASKSFNTYMKIIKFLVAKRFDRKDCIIALGGGVVGDLSGFVSSSYLRGIDFIQVPTTLLSQVDSSVGGKTAINISEGKNLVGAFYNPKKVLISTKYLLTLSEKEYKSGLGEILKYAFIGNKNILKMIKNNPEAIVLRDKKILTELIYESIKTKSKIVVKDEKESGIRAVLNFGHTFGHAIEAYEKYNKITHGEAVVMGMMIAGRISNLEGLLSDSKYNQMINLASSLNLNNNYKKYQYSQLKKFLKSDKKVEGGKLNLILINNNFIPTKTNNYNQKNISKAFN